MTSCDSLPLTRLEGLKELTRQLHDNKHQIRELLKECHGTRLKLVMHNNAFLPRQTSREPVLSLVSAPPVAEPSDSVLVRLVLGLLQLCKLAANHPEGADILGMESNKSHGFGVCLCCGSSLVGTHSFVFTQAQTQIMFLQRQRAAVWGNWAPWTSPPSLFFTAETPCIKRTRPASTPQSPIASTSS